MDYYSKRGGARKGAGRPKLGGFRITIRVMNEEEAQKVKEYAKEIRDTIF